MYVYILLLYVQECADTIACILSWTFFSTEYLSTIYILIFM